MIIPFTGTLSGQNLPVVNQYLPVSERADEPIEESEHCDHPGEEDDLQSDLHASRQPSVDSHIDQQRVVAKITAESS